MEGLKKCKQCGEIKSEILFREYYGRGRTTKGTRTGSRYKTCKQCESINGRYKYLTKKENRSESENAEIASTETLYEIQKSFGFRPPNVTPKVDEVADLVQEMLAKYKNKTPEVPEVPVELHLHDIPTELQEWLARSFSGSAPEDLQDEFDKVEAKYRPQTGLNSNLEPQYDNTYKKILDSIQDRLDDHEDDYYME